MAEERNSSISYALLARKQFLDLLRNLELNKDFVPEEVVRIGELMQNFDSKIFYPIILERLEKLESTFLLKKYEYLLKYLDYEGFVPLLVNLLPKVVEKLELKRTIISVLKYYDVSFSSPSLKKYREIVCKEMEKVRNKFVDVIENQDLNSLCEVMGKFFNFEEEEMIEIITELATLGEKSLPILELMLKTGINNVIEKTIVELSKIKEGRSLQILKEAMEYLPTKYFHLIDRAIKKLNFMGIQHSAQKEKDIKVLKIYLSYPYSFRGRQIGIAVSENQNIHFLFFDIKEEKGIYDVINVHFFLSEEELKRIVQKYCDEFILKEVKLSYGILIFADGVRRNYVNDVPFHPFFSVAASLLPLQFIKPMPYDPESIKKSLGGINLPIRDIETKGSNIWKEISKLNWLSGDERFRDIIKKWYMNSNKESPWLNELLIRKVLREMIVPNIYSWKERLFLLADFLYNTSKEPYLVFDIIEVAESLTSKIEVMEELPFIRTFILESKNIVLNDLED